MRRKQLAGVAITALAALGAALAIGLYAGWLWALVASPILLLAIGIAVQATGALSRGEEERP